MNKLAAVNAKVDRARSELRRLESDIADFCRERARLILREEHGDEEHWVYRGDTPTAPVEWSVRAGEFAYNLRSALDHLIWRLVEANGGSPDKLSSFPIYDQLCDRRNRNNFERHIRGISQSGAAYIESVQPHYMSDRFYAPDAERVARGLGMLHEICNMDKHRHLAIANVRWTGRYPRWVSLASFYPTPEGDEKAYLDIEALRLEAEDLLINHELRNDQALLRVPFVSEWQRLEFPVDAFFAALPFSHRDGRRLSVSETLSACIDSVEIVVSRLKLEIDA